MCTSVDIRKAILTCMQFIAVFVRVEFCLLRRQSSCAASVYNHLYALSARLVARALFIFSGLANTISGQLNFACYRLYSALQQRRHNLFFFNKKIQLKTVQISDIKDSINHIKFSMLWQSPKIM
jgi:hypothetical protein